MTILAQCPRRPSGLVPCYYCGIGLNRRKTWDHLVPKKFGGVDLPANMVIACKKCNAEKGCLTVEQYRQYRTAVNTVNTIKAGRSGIAPITIPGPVVFQGERLPMIRV